jgi:hypothetical protein
MLIAIVGMTNNSPVPCLVLWRISDSVLGGNAHLGRYTGLRTGMDLSSNVLLAATSIVQSTAYRGTKARRVRSSILELFLAEPSSRLPRRRFKERRRNAPIVVCPSRRTMAAGIFFCESISQFPFCHFRKTC